MPVHVALLRAIGPATHARMSMRDLREGCLAAGLDRVTTYIQTGNLIIGSGKPAEEVQAAVEAVLRRFGLDNAVVLRRPAALAAIVAADPFPEAAAKRPGTLCACFPAAPPDAGRLAGILSHPGPERIALVGDGDLCVDYPAGIAGSKLLPGVIERRLGTLLTARNWNTVRKLLARACPDAGSAE